MKRICRILCLTITASVLSSCGFLQYYEQNMLTGIDGKWIDENGIISSFHNGAFETRAADTEEKLSEGTYNYVSTQHIEIEIRSILRGTISRVNCTISHNATQLLCTSHTGTQFFLKRKF
ncbi:hypothetical protein HWV54_04760 [Bartonella alsatica]|uniref:Outer membrane lipoprotein omp10 n=2 Tax=Bartonella alsatica TaxID=52764 RepID=J1IWA7_9HYPH|nr:hypothetical protein [Bartonella alsatica]EJF75480.1 hypothetical protein MEC_00956 [Bartonella alsatica IBS 382]QLC52188.1 hypothetical protein HWV54_04760 [Bartonella alsatica]